MTDLSAPTTGSMGLRVYFVSVAVLFLVSGLTSLVYQSLWIRVLSLGVGSTSTSASLVLAIFFFGLSVGSFAFGRMADRFKRPLLAYGIVEAFIGIYSFGLIHILFEFHTVLSTIYSGNSFSTTGTLLKFFLVFVLLTPPTVCMGASLPLLVRLLTTGQQSIASSLSLLYGINTLGAVVGAFLAGYAFIPEWGIITSNNVMAIINILILPASYIIQQGVADSDIKVKERTSQFSISRLSGVQKMVLVSVFITGFASISAEVIWSKYLSIFFGSNIFGLSLLLSIFLAGLAFGSLVLSVFVNRVTNRLNLYIWLLLTVTLFVYLATVLLNFAPVVTNLISYFAGDWVSVLTIKGIVAGFIIFLPTSILGALLPLSILLVSGKKKNAAVATGFVYGLNTLGSILGSALTGLILIPKWGSGVALQIDLLLFCVFGVLLILVVQGRVLSQLFFVGTFTVLGALALFTEKVSFNNIIKSAYYQATPENLTLSQALEFFSKDSETFNMIIEGRTAVISLSQSAAEGPGWEDYYRLKTNGLNESLYDMQRLKELPKYEALLGVLPYTLARNPESAFIVGYGGGFTVDFMSSTSLKEVYVSELEEGIIDASNYIYENNNPILARENVKLRIEDARYVLTAGLDKKYDIIVSQPSHSWLTGVANLFTQEYFHIVKNNLSDDGVFSQWLNLYNMDKSVLNSILKTFYSVFPHGMVFTDLGDEEMIMIGTLQPMKFDFKRLQNFFQSKSVQESLRDFPSPHALLATYTVDRERILKFVEDAPLNTDRNAFAEVSQSRLFYLNHSEFPEQHLLDHYDGNVEKIVEMAGLNRVDLSRGILDALEKLPGEARSHQKFYRYVNRFEHELGDQDDLAGTLGYYKFQLEQYHSARKYLEQAMATSPTSRSYNHLMLSDIQNMEYEKAEKTLNKYRRFANSYSRCLRLAVEALVGDWKKADRTVRGVIEKGCGGREDKYLGLYYYYRSDLEKAMNYLERAINADAYDLESQELLIAVYLMMGHSSSAMTQFESYRTIFDQENQRIESLVSFYQSEGFLEDAEALKARYVRFYY